MYLISFLSSWYYFCGHIKFSKFFLSLSIWYWHILRIFSITFLTFITYHGSLIITMPISDFFGLLNWLIFIWSSIRIFTNISWIITSCSVIVIAWFLIETSSYIFRKIFDLMYRSLVHWWSYLNLINIVDKCNHF